MQQVEGGYKPTTVYGSNKAEGAYIGTCYNLLPQEYVCLFDGV